MYFKYQDIKLYYEKYGTEPESLIILPGWGNTRKTWNHIISQLEPYFTIYILDYPGFGNTEFPNRDLTLYDYTNMVRTWITSLHLEHPILLGHSMGGRIIIQILGYYKDYYKKAILLDSAGIKPKPQRWKSCRYQFQKKLAKLLPKSKRAIYLESLVQKYGSDDYKALPKYMRKTFSNIVGLDLQYYLNKINTNVMIVHGENDLVTPIEDAYKMHQLISNSQLKIIAQVGHFPYLDQTDTFIQIIYDMTKEKPPS